MTRHDVYASWVLLAGFLALVGIISLLQF